MIKSKKSIEDNKSLKIRESRVHTCATRSSDLFRASLNCYQLFIQCLSIGPVVFYLSWFAPVWLIIRDIEVGMLAGRTKGDLFTDIGDTISDTFYMMHQPNEIGTVFYEFLI